MRVVVVAALLVAAAAPAHADGLYFTESFGGATFKNQFAAHSHGGTRIRAGFGYRGGRTSVEAWFGADISDPGATAAFDAPVPPSPSELGLDVKYAFPLASHLETYLRGSMSKMQIADGSSLDGYEGRGLGFGAGVQVKGHAPLLTLLYPPISLICLIPDTCSKSLGPMATVSLFFDEGYDFYRLHDPGQPSIDVEATRWTIGFAVGSDF